VPKESVLFGIAGVFVGLLLGWIIGSQQAGPARPTPPAPEAQSAQSQAATPPPIDEARVSALKSSAQNNPKDAAVRVELGNLYFDHEQYRDAVQWYEDALRIDPKSVDVSTDLGIGYYYMNQPDRALEQFNRSLQLDPSHAKTLLNIGIVRAFGKQDLEGAAKAWQRVVDLAPDSPEGQRARQALAGLRSAHPDGGGGGGAQARPQDKPE
jgi:cytochrome c-type biogenesis protein CcmH/NrfG